MIQTGLGDMMPSAGEKILKYFFHRETKLYINQLQIRLKPSVGERMGDHLAQFAKSASKRL
jgi:hypothetical protein